MERGTRPGPRGFSERASGGQRRAALGSAAAPAVRRSAKGPRSGAAPASASLSSRTAAAARPVRGRFADPEASGLEESPCGKNFGLALRRSRKEIPCAEDQRTREAAGLAAGRRALRRRGGARPRCLQRRHRRPGPGRPVGAGAGPAAGDAQPGRGLLQARPFAREAVDST